MAILPIFCVERVSLNPFLRSFYFANFGNYAVVYFQKNSQTRSRLDFFLQKEISSRLASHVEVKVHSLPKRQYATWRGAAHMTSLQLSRSRWITKSEYEEHGASAIHGKYL